MHLSFPHGGSRRCERQNPVTTGRRRPRALIAAGIVLTLVGGGLVLSRLSQPAAPSDAAVVTTPDTRPDPNLIDRATPIGAASAILPTGDGPAESSRPVRTEHPGAEASSAQSHVPGRTKGRKQAAPTSSATLIIPTLGVNARVIPEGIDTTRGNRGNLTIPGNVRQVGWWAGGPAPGQPGTAVLASHRARGGVFYNLPSLQGGDTVQVRGTNGQLTTWRVTAVQLRRKSALPSEIWKSSGPPQLVLVTCGGVFNNRVGHFNDNVIVWAVPA